MMDKLTIKLRRSLKTGIADAMIQAKTHMQRAIPTQELMATQSRLCMRSVPRKMRT